MSSLLKKIQHQAPRQATEPGSAVPESFVDFCAWMRVDLTPGQAEFARVAYDGVEPVDGALAARIFCAHAESGTVPLGRRRVVAAVCGRRAGKSYIMVALRLVHGMLVRDVPPLPPGIRAVSMIIAPRSNMRDEVFAYALGAVESKPELRAMLVSSKAETFTLKRPDGKLVTFECGVATAGGTAARGRWFLDFALDECAFFRDNTFKVNDEELYKAGRSVLLPGGQILITSTPWAETGLLYRMWKTRPDNAHVAHAPTLVMNDNHITREIVTEAEAEDADSAAREFGAQFMTSGTTVFFESSSLDGMLTDEPFALQPGDVVGAGGDFGFKADSSALLMVAMRGKTLHIFAGTEERPSKGAPLKPSQTVKRFVEVIAGRCGYVVGDGHHRASIEEHLQEHGLVYCPAPQTPAENYVTARQKLREGVVKVHTEGLDPDLVVRLLQQLRETQGKPTAGGGMSIRHPRWAMGGHGDLADAFTLAIWRVCGTPIATPEPVEGSPEWVALQRAKRRQRHYEKATRPFWKKAS